MYGRSRILTFAAVLVVAGSVAAGIVLAFGDTSRAAPLTKEEYFARVAAICQVYGPELDKVPPPGDIATPAEVASPLQLALPLVVAELREVRALRPPAELAEPIRQWLILRDRAVAIMRQTLKEALLPDIRQMGPHWLQFELLTKQAGELGGKIGFPKVCARG